MGAQPEKAWRALTWAALGAFVLLYSASLWGIKRSLIWLGGNTNDNPAIKNPIFITELLENGGSHTHSLAWTHRSTAHSKNFFLYIEPIHQERQWTAKGFLSGATGGPEIRTHGPLIAVATP